MANYIIIAVLAVIIFLILRSQFRNRRKGQCSGGCGGCSGCTGCAGCAEGTASNAVTESRSTEQ